MAQTPPAEMADLSDDDTIAVLPDRSRSISADTTDTDIMRSGNERELQGKWRPIMAAFNVKSVKSSKNSSATPSRASSVASTASAGGSAKSKKGRKK